MGRRLEKQDIVDYVAAIEGEFGLRIVEKTTSRFMKALNLVVGLFNKRFMEGYVTTIGGVIYWPHLEDNLGQNPDGHFCTVTHELQHYHDSKRLPVLYELAYIAPQVLALLALLALLAICCGSGWLWALVAIVMAAPLPSPGRALIELRGNGAGMAAEHWLRGGISEQRYDNRLEQFTGRWYYFMWPFPKAVKASLVRRIDRARQGNMTRVQGFAREFLVSRGIIG